MIEKIITKLSTLSDVECPTNLQIAGRILEYLWDHRFSFCEIRYTTSDGDIIRYHCEMFDWNIDLFYSVKPETISAFYSIWRVAIRSDQDYLYIKTAHYHSTSSLLVMVKYSSEEFLHGVNVMIEMKS